MQHCILFFTDSEAFFREVQPFFQKVPPKCHKLPWSYPIVSAVHGKDMGAYGDDHGSLWKWGFGLLKIVSQILAVLSARRPFLSKERRI